MMSVRPALALRSISAIRALYRMQPPRRTRLSRPPARFRVRLALALILSLCTLGTDAGPSGPGQYPQHIVPVAGDDAWHGRLRAITFAPVSAEAGHSAPADAWEADALLTGTTSQPPRPPGSRLLWTAREVTSESNVIPAHIPLRSDTLSPHQRQYFSTAPDGTADGMQDARLAYLRGDRHLEGSAGWRARSGLLGAMRGATPRVVGAPQMLFTSGSQLTFARAHQLRTPLVFVGANDGLLHAFELASGAERFAYAPAALLPWLATFPHASAVRRPPVCPRPAAADAELAGQWRTVLACSTGADTAGLFVWDITDPDVAREHGLLWEVDATTLPALGHTPGPAPIVGLAVRPQAGPANTDGRRWFVVSGNGTAAPAGSRETAPDAVARQPVLLLLALDHRHGQPWQAGRDYWQLSTPPGTRGALGVPSIATDVLGQPVAAYAGDSAGTLWRFDLRGALPWDDMDRRATALLHGRTRSGKPLDLTAPPLLLHGTGGTLVLASGTPSADATGDGGTLFAALDDGSTVLNRDALSAASVTATTSGSTVVPGAAQAGGWLLDLPHAGERPATLEAIGHGLVRLVTETADGTSRQYLLHGANGSAPAPDSMTGAIFDARVLAAPILNFAPAGSPHTSTQGTTRLPLQLQSWMPDATAAGGWTGVGAGALSIRTGRLAWRELPMEPP